MDKNSATKLIKAKALGCLEQIEEIELSEFMETAEEFPWAELGEYQNLVSLLPLYLPLELPGNEVKDNLVNKLTELRNQLFPVQEEEQELVEEELPAFEEEKVPDEVEINMQDIDVDVEPDLSIQDNVIPDEPEEEILETKEEISSERRPTFKRDIFDEQREKSDRRIRESIKKLDDEIAELEQTVKRNFMISLGVFVVLIVIVIFIYLSLSSRISDQQDKLDTLQNSIGLLIPQPQNSPENINIS